MSETNKLDFIKSNLKKILIALVIFLVIISIISLFLQPKTGQKKEPGAGKPTPPYEKPSLSNWEDKDYEEHIEYKLKMAKEVNKQTDVYQKLPVENGLFIIEKPSMGKYTVILRGNDNKKARDAAYDWFAASGVVDKSKLNILWIDETTIKN